MLRIAVCEDEAAVHDYLEGKIGEYAQWEVCTLQKEKERSDSGQKVDILFVKSEEKEEDKWKVHIRQEVLDVLNKGTAEQTLQRGKEPMLIRANGSYYRIEREKILYAENVGRKVVLHMKNNQIAYYAKMKEAEEVLGSQFFRCHRGYLVNLKAVKSYEAGSILLKNGERVLMAKQKYNDFVAVYTEYLRRKS